MNILKKVSEKITPAKEEIREISSFVKDFSEKVKKEFGKKKVSAEIFVGGSFAKNTLIKKGIYDVDIFVRFDEKYKNSDISEILENAIRKIKAGKISRVHGSRDYFKIEPEGENFFMEIIPVIKIKNPREAENITDLSYFHVNYIRRRLNTEKFLEETRLAKAFCHATKCYGAESYINGFSGYALELLIYKYKGFVNFVKAMTKIKLQNKEIIDIEKLYKNKIDLQMNMNSAKMSSPIILVDPTYRERNALAALSSETFANFQEACRKFLENPSEKMFEVKEVNFEASKKKAEKNKLEFTLFEARTDKQEGDVAGSKLLKFYKHLAEELERFYEIKEKDFEYDGKIARFFFSVKKKKEIIFSGPETKDKSENIKRFKQRHKEIFEKKGKLYAREKNNKNFHEFLKCWINTNCEKIREMYISELRIIEN